jgi:hypothetical protein
MLRDDSGGRSAIFQLEVKRLCGAKRTEICGVTSFCCSTSVYSAALNSGNDHRAVAPDEPVKNKHAKKLYL